MADATFEVEGIDEALLALAEHFCALVRRSTEPKQGDINFIILANTEREGTMTDGCYCEWHEGETPEFWSEVYRTAHREHKCCECSEIIKPGEKYQVYSGKWDGQLAAFKTCNYCARLRNAAWDNGYEGCFGQLACYVFNHPTLEPLARDHDR